MRLHILSDLHTEFEPFELEATGADVLVLAGDIGTGTKGLDWARATGKASIYVAGNHEFYGDSIPDLTRTLRAGAAGGPVHFLENEACVIGGVRFLGCVLWSDFALFGEDKRDDAMFAARYRMNDFKRIRFSPGDRVFAPSDALGLHRASVEFLERELARPHPGPTVVVTHAAPSDRSRPDQWEDDLMSAAFCSNLDALVEASGAALWVHGHTHHSVDYRIGRTRVLSNQRCYPHEDRTGFDPALTIDL